MSASPTNTLDPDVFLALEDLELVGRGLGTSVWQGRHRSKIQGEGTEFHRHRPYQPGDDLRRLNWGLYARHRGLFTKESQLESQRPVYILLDATASMSVAHGPTSKFEYARRVAAGLAWLADRSGDLSSLGMWRNGLEDAIEPGGGQAHFLGVCATLAKAEANGSGDFGSAMHEAMMLCRQPGFVIILSDFLDEEDRPMAPLADLVARGHDVFALQILDPVEVELPPRGDFEFIDTETGERLKTSAEPIRKVHAAAVQQWRDSLRNTSMQYGLRWCSTHTAEPMAPVLRTWLDGNR